MSIITKLKSLNMERNNVVSALHLVVYNVVSPRLAQESLAVFFC